MNLQELTELKEQIQDSKTKKAELEGQLKLYKNQLKEDFECLSMEEAEKKLKTMSKEIEQLEEEIETRLDELEEKIDEQNRDTTEMD